jgi:hypothetical protein
VRAGALHDRVEDWHSGIEIRIDISTT